jgi:hypothetical protein
MNSLEFISSSVPKVTDSVQAMIIADISGNSSNEFILWISIFFFIVLLMVVAFMVIKLVRKKKNVLFEESLKRANNYLINRNFVAARDEYLEMKKIVELNKNEKMRNALISFYNKYKEAENEK